MFVCKTHKYSDFYVYARKKRNGTMKKIIPFLTPYRGKTVLAMLLVSLATVCDLLLPTIMSSILNNGVRQADFAYIARCCGLMLLVAALGLTTLLLGRKLSAQVVAGFNGDIRSAVFRRVNEIRFEDFESFGTAALLTRSTNDVNTISWIASLVSGSLITIPILFIGGVALAMRKSVTLSLILLASIPLVFGVVLLASRGITPLHEKSDHYIDVQNDLMRERLHGIRVIRAFNKEQMQHDKIADATRVMAENIINANVRMQAISPIGVFFLNVSVLIILWAGSVQIGAGRTGLTGGDVFAIVQYAALIANGVMMAGMAVVMFPHAQVAARRISEVLDLPPADENGGDSTHCFGGAITFDHVTFRYDGAVEPAVSDISLTILPGQKVSVIGGTGSGKSTLVQLLLAFRSPTEGRILFDGVDAAGLEHGSIRRSISCVLQRAAVYTGTIRRNIQLGSPDASEAEIQQAASIAQLSDYIATLPDGLEHELAESGKNLSGGQKQRLCIARAIVKDAPIYIFDDSFSALDFLTEARLRQALNEKIAGRTQIVITQRITSAMNSDQIFVMDKGRLIDHGTHTQLLERCAIYREIYASQTGGGSK